MPGPIITDTRPNWQKPETQSVLDSPVTKALRLLASMTGIDSLQGQAAAMGAPMGVPDATGVEGGLMGALQRVIKAYHGSPHDFNAFDASKIGTGEGAQAYGHGLYFAENKNTADVYKNALGGDALKLPSGEVVKPQPGSVEDRALAFLATYSGGGQGIENPYQFARNEVQKMIDRGYGFNRANEAETLPKIKDMLSEWERAGVKASSGGKTYEVAIKAHPDQFLNWDLPLSQQSEHVQKALESIGVTPKANVPWQAHQVTRDGEFVGAKAGDWVSVQKNAAGSVESWGGKVFGTERGAADNAIAREGITPPGSLRTKGGELYQYLGQATKQKASEALKQAGIPGIKYLDQGSRGTGQGTSNYVVFDDKLVEILKKYGVALPVIDAMRRKADAQGGYVSLAEPIKQ